MNELQPDGSGGCTLFSPGIVYPHLRLIHLHRKRRYSYGDIDHVTSEEQLQQLCSCCSCCPAADNLAVKLHCSWSAEACLPLLQLSNLTGLQMSTGGADAVAAVAIDVLAQLTGLKDLELQGHYELPPTALLQLTALIALEKCVCRGHPTPFMNHAC
jgi:hypothetical protein